MPFIQIKTNVKVNVEDHENFLCDLTNIIANLTQKPYHLVAVSLIDSATLFFGGTKDPTYIVNLIATDLTTDIIKTITKELCTFLKNKLDIEGNRGFIYFFDFQRSHVGHNGHIFD
ncbi:hypothetical protein RclHR1_11300010 [Rhizophagus clarus]|uniref:L-dopachrome isomerase n=1 Tax=Rhizophagus clarus TaxID=94130 RepID=A0A2Z6QJ29_9GLOM|nr:hypothetical protein RclHR1_11300010 [Rhizophagus clarus]GES82269.1 macrophage migration inhibitory factor homolog [Rhizophagus clarus]